MEVRMIIESAFLPVQKEAALRHCGGGAVELMGSLEMLR